MSYAPALQFVLEKGSISRIIFFLARDKVALERFPPDSLGLFHNCTSLVAHQPSLRQQPPALAMDPRPENSPVPQKRKRPDEQTQLTAPDAASAAAPIDPTDDPTICTFPSPRSFLPRFSALSSNNNVFGVQTASKGDSQCARIRQKETFL